MDEKRFELDKVGIFDNKTNHFYYKTFDNEEVVNLLNTLSEENEQLKKELNSFEPVMFQDMRKGTVTLYSKEVTE